MHTKVEQIDMIPRHAFTWDEYIEEIEDMMERTYDWASTTTDDKVADSRPSLSCPPTRPTRLHCKALHPSSVRHCSPGQPSSASRTVPLVGISTLNHVLKHR